MTPKKENKFQIISDNQRTECFEEYQENHVKKNNFQRVKIFEIAGSIYYKSSFLLRENDVLSLVPEPENQYNKNAIGIYSDFYGKVGHIKDVDLEYCHNLLSQNCNLCHVCSVKLIKYDLYPDKLFIKISVPFPKKNKK